MSIRIRKMKKEEFDFFFHWSAEQNVRELMAERCLSREAAVKETEEELAKMLPMGLETPDHCLMTVEKEDTQENLGAIWTIFEESEGKKQSFVCDFVIWEPYRRRGFAEEALRLAEEKAVEAGCRESVLFVADCNAAANALYQKSGYQLLRQADYGKYMVKQL